MPEEHRHPLGPDGAAQLPELPAPPSPGSGDVPAQAPIRLDDLEAGNAKLPLKRPIELAAAVVPGVDALEAEKLVGAMIDRVVARSRSGGGAGISIAELAAAAGIGQGRIGQRFNVNLQPFANLVVRAIHAQAGRRVFYEELSSHSSKAGRRHNGVGTEKVPKAPNSLHMLAYSLGSSDRHCPAASEPLTTGTRWDRQNPRFGAGLPDWTRGYNGRIPSSFAEHLERVLRSDRRVRAKLAKVMTNRRVAFSGSLTRERLLASFSRFLVVPPIPYGRPEAPHHRHRGILFPGRDTDAVERAAVFGRHVALACGEPTPDERLEFEEGSERLPAGPLPWMYELGIHMNHAVEYRWSPTRHELGRYEAGRGGGLEIWRLVGYDGPKSFWRMLSSIERWSQVSWTEGCTRRWEEDCRPGLQKAHMPASCAGVRALLEMANAAIVDALRRQARPAGGVR